MPINNVDKQTAKGLLTLKARIKAAKIPPSSLDQSIILATWNVREFGKKRRLKPSLAYITEILRQFDVIALVELRDTLGDLAEVLHMLGEGWKVVYSSYLTDSGGNHERVAYIYDERAVKFTGLACWAEPPRFPKKRGTVNEYLPTETWWRNPYMASFKAGSFDFVLMGVHTRWSKDIKTRVKELQRLADWVEDRRQEPGFEDQDIIVIGDFNIPSLKDATYKAISSHGLSMPKALAGITGSNLEQNKRYDQILHYPAVTRSFTGHGGVVDFYAGDHKRLFPGKMTRDAFTYQLSDHLPLWIEVDTDTEEEQLDGIIHA